MTRLILICALSVFCAPSPAQENEIASADRLFGGRDNVESLKQAVATLEGLLPRQGKNYEVMWRLAKYRYYLADREKAEANRIKLLEGGMDAAKKAIALNEKRVEGHFWLGANTGEYADMKGAFTSLGLISTIRKEFEKAFQIDAAYENGSVYVALGEMDLSLPRLLGGNDRRGLEMLEKGLLAAPANVELKVTLAGRYIKKGRNSEAKRLLEAVANLIDPLRTPKELEELRSKARAMLDELK
ncbi:MAG TPA: TRAP transporter TatT component family protein [Blastocatellia bacterium]|nr:TRAP transporter TatT component family protein [Blastocatellia bacterium]